MGTKRQQLHSRQHQNRARLLAESKRAVDTTMPVNDLVFVPVARPVPNPLLLREQGTLALLAVSGAFVAASLCILAAYFLVSSIDLRFALFWAGMVILVLICAWAFWLRRFSSRAQLAILAAAGIISYLPKLFRSYDYPTYSDELLHLGQANLLESGIFFGHNSTDPVVGYFPLYQILVVFVHLVTTLSMWSSSLVVAGLGHVGQLLGVYVLVAHISGSRRIGGMAAIFWLTGPAVLFWMSEASYQTVALALAFFTVYACLRAADGTTRRVWIPTAVAGMLATTAAQPVAGLFVAAFVLVLAACDIDGGIGAALRRRTRWRPSVLFACGLTSLAINVGWIAVTDWGGTWTYLLPKWSTLQDALSALVNLSSHRDPFSASGLPFYEQYTGYASLVLTALALAAALFLYFRGRLQRAVSPATRRGIRASFVLAAMFVLSMPFVLSVEAAIWVHRLQELVWIGVCILFAFLLSWSLKAAQARGRRASLLMTLGAMAFVVVLLVGNTATTASADARFRLPYTFGRGAGMVTTDQREAALWLGRFHPGARIATDPNTAYVQWAYGEATWVSDRFPVWELTFGYPIGGQAVSSVKRFDVQFIVIDMLMYREANVGHIYSNQEPDIYAGKPVPYSAYQRLIAVAWVTVVFSNSQISILELSPPRGP